MVSREEELTNEQHVEDLLPPEGGLGTKGEWDRLQRAVDEAEAAGPSTDGASSAGAAATVV
jgi:hypothetical protein